MTNIQMYNEIKKHYDDNAANIKRGVLGEAEHRKIMEVFDLKNRTVIDLRNVRDMVVMFTSTHRPEDRADKQAMKDYDNAWDMMSAITHVIDMMIVCKGGDI